MPRSKSLIRLSVLGAALLALTATRAQLHAQDAAKVAEEAQKKRADIQKKLAAGKEVKDGAEKDNPNLKRLRVDAFKEDNGKVAVTGVFIDAAGKGGDAESQVGDAAKDLILKALGTTEKVLFNWKGVKTVGAGGEGDPAPHVALQTAANKAEAEGTRDDARPADRVFLTASEFGPDGELVLSGYRGKDKAVEDWLKGDGLKALAGHPAAARAANDPPRADFARLTPVETWPLHAPEIQKVLAGSKDVALRRLRADRAYFAYDGAEPKFAVAGVRLGEDKLDDVALQDALRQLWPTVLGGAKPIRLTLGFGAALTEPVDPLQAAVVERRALDGVRVDPGAEFGAGGELKLAGVQPGLNEEQQKELNEAYQGVVKAIVARGGASDRYRALLASKAAVGLMKRVPVYDLRDDLRAWAIRTKDDVRLRRLYFNENLESIARQHYAVAKDCGGLVLVYQVADPNDVKAVEAEFARLVAKHFPQGLIRPRKPVAPEAPANFVVPAAVHPRHVALTHPVAVAVQPTDPAHPDLKDKEPLLPGLTAAIRAAMTRDQKKWYGVLIERGYFDANDRYTLAGVVDRDEQNEYLRELLAEFKKDPKWAAYFSPEPNPPALTRIPMGEMLDRVKRVTPAYPVFDGTRIESARYDEKGNLVFDAHVVGQLDRDATPLLARLLREHPQYRRRAPADKQVRIVRVAGPDYADEQVANFSLAFGAKLLIKADPTPAERAKAKVWLDVALLHYPNEAGVWFLSAYYNFTDPDEKDRDRKLELVRRDLYRVIDLEGPLAFNGPSQRKRRYEAAKDFQGVARNELEALWLDCFREVKDGARPITLASGK